MVKSILSLSLFALCISFGFARSQSVKVKKWAFETGDRVWTNPAIGSNGTIYVGSWDKNLYAINPDGSMKWRIKTRDDVESSPAIGSDGTIYVGSDDINLYAINPDGSKKWAFKTRDDVDSPQR